MPKKKPQKQEKNTPERNEKGHFVGSGNPGGRPKGAVKLVTEAAQKHTTRAIEILATIMEDVEESAADRIKACNSILDRGVGRIPQEIKHEGSLQLPQVQLVPFDAA